MSRIFMPRPAKKAATSGGSGAAALDTVAASPRPSRDRIGASPHLLPDPRHAEERGRAYRPDRIDKPRRVRAEVHMPDRGGWQVEAEHALGDVSQWQVGHPPDARLQRVH